MKGKGIKLLKKLMDADSIRVHLISTMNNFWKYFCCLRPSVTPTTEMAGFRVVYSTQNTVRGTASSSHGALIIISTVPDFSQIYLLHKNNATWLFIKVIFFILIYLHISQCSFDIIKNQDFYLKSNLYYNVGWILD